MAQLEFDEGQGKQLEAMYRRRDVIRRRLVMNALSANLVRTSSMSGAVPAST